MTNHVNARKLMSDAKFYDGYSRWDEKLGKYENWDQAVDRVMDMHRQVYSDKLTPELEALISKATESYKDKRILGAQRALQFGGDQLLRHNLKLYNCTSAYADRPKFFNEIFYVLLCGAGAGFSAQKHHVTKLPKIVERKKQAKIFHVEDSIEGWADSVGVLLGSYFEGGGAFPEYEGRRVYFDTTSVRPKGAMISGGFKAPGPEPLRRSLDKIEYLLQGLILKGIDQLRPIDVYDIVMHIADAVLAGGVRRSATICLFSPTDEEMLNAKTGNWLKENPQRARSNNSAVLVRSQLTREQFAHMMKSVRQFGEPGFVLVESTEHCFNPCVTGDTLVNTDQGLRRADSLINKQFKAVVNGVAYQSGGFIKTGNQSVYKISTSRGHSVGVTSNHKMLVVEDGKQIWREAGDLSLGDALVIGQNLTYAANKDSKDFQKGWLIGGVVGDGGHNPKKYPSYIRFWGIAAMDNSLKAADYIANVFGGKVTPHEFRGVYTVASADLTRECAKFLTSKDKDFTDQLFDMGDDFLAGLVQGYFDADGTVFGSSKRQGIAVRLCSNNYSRLQQMQTILNRFGIVASIYAIHPAKNALLPDGKGGKRYYPAKKTYDLHFSRSSVDAFVNLCGFGDAKKIEVLQRLVDEKSRPSYKNHLTTEVTSVEFDGVVDVFDCCVEEVHRFEANGLIVHNCVEVGMFPQIQIEDKVESGFQGCNLVEINGSKALTLQEFLDACESAAVLGTLQAGYTNFPYLSEATKKIFEREALLGVSITGWMNSPDVLFSPENLREGARLIKKTNRLVAKLIGINPAARTTCVKPAGNASVILMTASGIGAEHSPRYLRTMQMNKDSEIAKTIRAKNPHMVEDGVWSASKTDYAIAFPVIAPAGSLFKDSMHGVEFLKHVRLVQQNWIEEGTDISLSVDPTVRHNVSNTVTVFENQWDLVEQYVFDNRADFAGISFLSASGDKDYEQAPFTEVLDAEQLISRYGDGAIFASGMVVDALKVFGTLWEATAVAQDSSNQSQEKLDQQSDWIRRFNKFAVNYFEGNVKMAEYCLKDSYLLHKWTKIQQNYVDIDFSTELVQATYTDIDTMGAAACVGPNGCEI